MGSLTIPSAGPVYIDTNTVIYQAARIRALSLKTPDALHAATGLVGQCSLFVTNDPIFQRVPKLPVAIL
jgi:predicted nucleic acid-binding protein